jgi:ferredoxin
LAGIVSPGLIGSLALLGIFPLVTKRLLEAFRKRSGGDTRKESKAGTYSAEPNGEQAFVRALEEMQSACTNCGACKSQCAFLKEYAADILTAFDIRPPAPGNTESLIDNT